MSYQLKQDIRNAVKQTLREELSKLRTNNEQAGECSNSENSQPLQTTAINQTLRGPINDAVDTYEAGSSTMSFRDFYRSRESSGEEDFKPSKKKLGGGGAK